MNTSECEKDDNFIIVSTTLLIGYNIKSSTKSSQSSMYMNPLFSNQLPITKSLLSLSNTEILLFLAIVFNTYDWLKSLNTHKKCPLKMELFRGLPFCKFTHSLCKIENIPMGGKRIVP